jgi:hypothetical protein
MKKWAIRRKPIFKLNFKLVGSSETIRDAPLNG